MASEQQDGLKARLMHELHAAMKARERTRVGALRMLTAAVKNREVELRRPLSDQEFIEVATREIKRRGEAIEAYEKAGRGDRAATELEERRVLEAYVPAGLTPGEVDALIEEAVAATAASGPGDLGKVMGFVMDRAKGRVNGRAVQEKARDRLGG